MIAIGDVAPAEICRRVRAAGVVGAGGAGFPTHAKLQAKAHIYLVNGAESEPLLEVDQQIAAEQAEWLIKGLLYGMAATAADEGIIAIKDKHHAAIERLRPLLPPRIRLHLLPDIYPAGDELITIWLATGRRVAPSARPLSVGVVVSNVQTVINMGRAVELREPVTQRTLTVTGAVHRPLTVSLPLGTPLRVALDLAGGTPLASPAFIGGGPMRGRLLDSLDETVGKTTSALLVLPDNHLLVRRRQQSIESVLAVARSACVQCAFCTDLCPRHLIGHELPPHLIVRSVSYQHVARPEVLQSALTCSECGVCEAHACPVGISPMRINQALKTRLRAEGVHYQGVLQDANPLAEQRLLPTKQLLGRLDLQPYERRAPLFTEPYQPSEVRLALQDRMGVAALPCVVAGQHVVLGECVAEASDDQLSTPLHASITGCVTAVSDTHIHIVANTGC